MQLQATPVPMQPYYNPETGEFMGMYPCPQFFPPSHGGIPPINRPYFPNQYNFRGYRGGGGGGQMRGNPRFPRGRGRGGGGPWRGRGGGYYNNSYDDDQYYRYFKSKSGVRDDDDDDGDGGGYNNYYGHDRWSRSRSRSNSRSHGRYR